MKVNNPNISVSNKEIMDFIILFDPNSNNNIEKYNKILLDFGFDCHKDGVISVFLDRIPSPKRNMFYNKLIQVIK